MSRGQGAVIAHAMKLKPRDVAAVIVGVVFLLQTVASDAQTEQQNDATAGIPEAVSQEPSVGTETKLPLPRFVSLKASRANVRRGPSRRHRVDWELLKVGIPLEIVAEFGLWRQIRTWGEVSGWIYFSVLTGTRTAVVTSESTAMRSSPDDQAPTIARVHRDSIGRIERCNPNWCKLQVEKYSGWIDKKAIWGIKPGELID